MNKHAVMIMAHNNLYILKKLILLLDSDYFDLFIHLDQKSDIEINDLKNISKKSKIFCYKKYDIRWADYSQVECELYLLKEALSKFEYTYFHLISGVDFLIKNNKKIHDFFESSGKEFVHFCAKKVPRKQQEYYNLYQFNMKKYRKNNFEKIKNKIYILFQKILCVDRNKHNDVIFMKGANWFSITQNLAKYIVDNEEWIEKTFYKTRSPDEFFVQTLVYNSNYKDNLYNTDYNDNYEACMRQIDWNRGNPYIFTIDDFEELKNSNCMFARKFDENKDKDIIDKLFYLNKI